MTVLLLLAACTGSTPNGPVVRFDLHLVPVVPYNEAPFEGSDRTELTITRSGADPLVVDLGALASGDTTLAEGIPELGEAVLTVSAWRADLLVGWGRTGTITVLDGDDIELPLFVARPGEVAWFSALPGTIYRPALGALGGGSFVAMGGTSAGSSGRLTREVQEIYRLELAPPDDALAFVEVGTLPEWTDYNGGTHTGRSGFDLQRISVPGEDEGKLLLAGGSALSGFEQATSVTASAFIYDPAANTFELLRDRDSFVTPRSEYLSLGNIQGSIVYWGGWTATNQDGYVGYADTAEIYDPVNRKFTDLGRIQDLGPADAAAADLGSEGTLICGGGVEDTSNSMADWVSSAVCVRVGLNGSVETAHDLPESRIGHAMVTLPDGRVLLAGGASSAITAQTPGDPASEIPAVGDVWLYNPNNDTWSDGGELGLPRAGHRMTVLPDGRVLVVGGSSTYLQAGLASEPLSCVEVFDPATGRSEVLADCSAGDDAGGLAGPAWQPSIAVDPEFGIVIAGGGASDSAAQDAVGLYLP